MRIKTLLLACLCTSLLVSSCTTYYYTPDAHIVPNFSNKKQLRVAGSLSSGRVSKSLESHIAYSFAKHWGAYAGATFTSRSEFNNNRSDHDVKYFQGGLVFFTPITKRINYEQLLGYGNGNTHITYNPIFTLNNTMPTTLSPTLNYQKLYIQPQIGFHHDFNKRIHLKTYLGVRLGTMQTKAITYTLDETDEYYELYGTEYEIDYFKTDKTFFLIEPAFTIMLGTKIVNAHVQLTRSANLTDRKFQQEQIVVQIGAQFHFDFSGEKSNRK